MQLDFRKSNKRIVIFQHRAALFKEGFHDEMERSFQMIRNPPQTKKSPTNASTERNKPTHRAVVEQIKQRDEEGSPVLPVSPHHGEKVRAERRAGLVMTETPDDRVPGRHYGLLDLVGHFHPRHSLHLISTQKFRGQSSVF